MWKTRLEQIQEKEDQLANTFAKEVTDYLLGADLGELEQFLPFLRDEKKGNRFRELVVRQKELQSDKELREKTKDEQGRNHDEALQILEETEFMDELYERFTDAPLEFENYMFEESMKLRQEIENLRAGGR